MKPSPFFKAGFRAMIPITAGAIPFGAVVGSVAANAGLDFFQTVLMNLLVYAGAASLAATELMTHHAAVIVVVATGLIINLRFLLYSAALAPDLREFPLGVRVACAYATTDQAYAATSANLDRLKTPVDAIHFYGGASLCMWLSWQLAVVLGFIFGNFAPASLALDFAVPLSFVALIVPSIRGPKHLAVALFSAAVSILLAGLPYRLNLIVTAVLAIGFGAWLTRSSARGAP